MNDMAKEHGAAVCKTDIRLIIFELEKACDIYNSMRTLTASRRAYRVNQLINKLRAKI